MLSRSPGKMSVAVAAAADASKRRRSILVGEFAMVMTPSYKTKGWRYPLRADFSATSPFPGDRRAALSRLVESARALGLDAKGRMKLGLK